MLSSSERSHQPVPTAAQDSLAIIITSEPLMGRRLSKEVQQLLREGTCDGPTKRRYSHAEYTRGYKAVFLFLFALLFSLAKAVFHIGGFPALALSTSDCCITTAIN